MLFIWDNKSVSQSNRFIWFKKWIIGRQILESIRQESGLSITSLKRYFSGYLKKPPVLSVFPSEQVNLIVDGTYFKNDLCLIIYRDNTIKFTQLYRLTDGEWYNELKEDLENLIKLGVDIQSITCDGHKALLKAISKICKHAVVQRCLVHIQRMCRIWLSAKPKSEAGVSLRRIVSKLHTVKTTIDRDYWIVSLVRWHEKHEHFINEKAINPETGRYWYKHKMVRRSFTVIRKALPDMFQYIDNPKIPNSTNGLESFFGHLKNNLNIHRGLSKQHRKDFIKWYLYFKNSTSAGFSKAISHKEYE